MKKQPIEMTKNKQTPTLMRLEFDLESLINMMKDSHEGEYKKVILDMLTLNFSDEVYTDKKKNISFFLTDVFRNGYDHKLKDEEMKAIDDLLTNGFNDLISDSAQCLDKKEKEIINIFYAENKIIEAENILNKTFSKEIENEKLRKLFFRFHQGQFLSLSTFLLIHFLCSGQKNFFVPQEKPELRKFSILEKENIELYMDVHLLDMEMFNKIKYQRRIESSFTLKIFMSPEKEPTLKVNFTVEGEKELLKKYFPVANIVDETLQNIELTESLYLSQVENEFLSRNKKNNTDEKQVCKELYEKVEEQQRLRDLIIKSAPGSPILKPTQIHVNMKGEGYEKIILKNRISNYTRIRSMSLESISKQGKKTESSIVEALFFNKFDTEYRDNFRKDRAKVELFNEIAEKITAINKKIAQENIKLPFARPRFFSLPELKEKMSLFARKETKKTEQLNEQKNRLLNILKGIIYLDVKTKLLKDEKELIDLTIRQVLDIDPVNNISDTDNPTSVDSFSPTVFNLRK